ncbi:MAG TPA: disulfide bond formation protein B [Caulobacter sp.]|nr:disulfide bond formation protein B [Caulobacter sp.]
MPAALKDLIDRCLRHWPLVAALSSALMLAIAHAFETFGHLAPCTLCLKAREVYWVALTVGLVAFAAQTLLKDDRARRLGSLILAAIFLFGVCLAVYHAGAEWKFWPGPKTCASGALPQLTSLDAVLKGGSIKAPACDEAAWVFLGLSMAGWNALISLKLLVYSLLAARLRRD